MAGKFKITGFARFFIFLIIAAPLIYSGVSIFKGENPLDAIQRDLGIEIGSSENNNSTDESDIKRMDLSDLKREIKSLKRENNSLREQLENCQ